MMPTLDLGISTAEYVERRSSGPLRRRVTREAVLHDDRPRCPDSREGKNRHPGCRVSGHLGVGGGNRLLASGNGIRCPPVSLRAIREEAGGSTPCHTGTIRRPSCLTLSPGSIPAQDGVRS